MTSATEGQSQQPLLEQAGGSNLHRIRYKGATAEGEGPETSLGPGPSQGPPRKQAPASNLAGKGLSQQHLSEQAQTTSDLLEHQVNS